MPTRYQRSRFERLYLKLENGKNVGYSHDLSDNGNRASIHWDMVKMLTDEYNGGKIIIDDELIQENGVFILEKLKVLNKRK